MKKRLTALMLAFVFVFTSAIAYAQTITFVPSTLDEAEARRLYHGMIFEEFSQSDLYQSTIERFMQNYGFSQEFSENYLRTLSYVDNLAVTFTDRYGDWVFPEYISGMYINDDGILVVQLAHIAATQTATSLDRFNSSLLHYINFNHVIVNQVEFSRAELNGVMEYLSNFMSSEQNRQPQIFNGISIRDNLNRVNVLLWDYNPEGKEFFRQNVLDSPMIVFEPIIGIPMDFGDFEMAERTERIFRELVEELDIGIDREMDNELSRLVWRALEAEDAALEAAALGQMLNEETQEDNFPFLSLPYYLLQQLELLPYYGIYAANSVSLLTGQALHDAWGNLRGSYESHLKSWTTLPRLTQMPCICYSVGTPCFKLEFVSIGFRANT